MDYIDPGTLRPSLPGASTIGSGKIYAGGSPDWASGYRAPSIGAPDPLIGAGGPLGGGPVLPPSPGGYPIRTPMSPIGSPDAPPVPMAPTIGAPRTNALLEMRRGDDLDYQQGVSAPTQNVAADNHTATLYRQFADQARQQGITDPNEIHNFASSNTRQAVSQIAPPRGNWLQEHAWATPLLAYGAMAGGGALLGAGAEGGAAGLGAGATEGAAGGLGATELGAGLIGPEAGAGLGLDSSTGLLAGGGTEAGIGGSAPGAENGFFSGSDGMFNSGVDEFGNPTQSNFQGGPGSAGGGDFFNPGGTATSGLPNMPPGASTAIQKLIGGGGNGLLQGAADNPLLAALLAAGVMEHPNNPLTQPTVNAVTGAIESGQKIQGLQIPGITPSFQRAIDTANTNVGAWKPYADESAGFTRAGGAPISGADIQNYMNPYVEQALNPAARKVSEAATAMRMADAAKSGARGAFGSERSDQLAKLNQRNELMSLGDLYGQGYSKAFDTALSTAGADKGRALTAGGAFQNLGTTVGGLGQQDVAGLTTAGGIETLPFSEEIGRSQAAGNVLTGAAGAGARAIGSTGQPSLLTNLTGAAGILDTLGRTKPSGTQPSGTPQRGPNLPSLPAFPSLPSVPSPTPATGTIGGSVPTDEFDW